MSLSDIRSPASLLANILRRLVLKTLDDALESEPDRKCFRLIGGVLVERTVKEVAPQVKTNKDGVSDHLHCSIHRLKRLHTRFDDCWTPLLANIKPRRKTSRISSKSIISGSLGVDFRLVRQSSARRPDER